MKLNKKFTKEKNKYFSFSAGPSSSQPLPDSLQHPNGCHGLPLQPVQERNRTAAAS
jgi:hypothetical protein